MFSTATAGASRRSSSGCSPRSPAAMTDAPLLDRQISTRCVFPAPPGPVSTTVEVGHAGHASISVSAAALAVPTRKSARVICGRCGKRSGSCRVAISRPLPAPITLVEEAALILFQIEPPDDANRRGERDRQEKPYKTEQQTEREERKDHPDGMQPHPASDETRLEHVAFQRLADNEDDHDGNDFRPARPELRERHSERDHEAGGHTQKRDETEQPGREPDEQAVVEAKQAKCNRVVDAEKQRHKQLPAHKRRDVVIDFAGYAANLGRVQTRY